MSNTIIKPLSLAIGATVVGSLSLTQLAIASSKFHATDLGSGYMVAMVDDTKTEGKGHEGKCGEGKCGADKFDKMDSNKDNKLSMDEMKAAHEGKCGSDKMDTNKDSMISKDEFMSAHKMAEEGKCGAHNAKGEEGKCGGDAKGEEGKCGAKTDKPVGTSA